MAAFFNQNTVEFFDFQGLKPLKKINKKKITYLKFAEVSRRNYVALHFYNNFLHILRSNNLLGLCQYHKYSNVCVNVYILNEQRKFSIDIL